VYDAIQYHPAEIVPHEIRPPYTECEEIVHPVKLFIVEIEIN